MQPPEAGATSVGDASRRADGLEVLELLLVLVAAIAYIHVIGWVITWVRLSAARVPVDASLPMIDNQILFLAGLRLVVVMAIVFAAMTFVDHALRYGDSLVGLSRRQIGSFHWKTNAPGLEAIRIGQHVAKVSELRAQIGEAGQDISDWTLRDMWDEAQTELEQVRLFGDLAVLAFFSAAKPKAREARRTEFALAVTAGDAERYRSLVEERREAAAPLVPFHWEIEFPEAFDRANGGFDAIVGNPGEPLARSRSSRPGVESHVWLPGHQLLRDPTRRFP
jgi:hypothetical protein